MTLPGCRWSGISLKNERKTVVSTNAAQTVSAIRPSSIPNQRMATDSDQIRFVTYFFTRLPWAIIVDHLEIGFLGLADDAVGGGRAAVGLDIADFDFGIGGAGVVFFLRKRALGREQRESG